MYYKLNEKEKEIVEKASDLTFEDYEMEGNFINVEKLMICIENLIDEINLQVEAYEDLKQDLEDNYEPISQAEQYDIHDRDFI